LLIKINFVVLTMQGDKTVLIL